MTNQLTQKEFEERADRFYKEHLNETPDEWGRSYSYFIYPSIFLVCSLFFIFVQRPTIFMVLLILAMNAIFSIYNILLWYNQRIYIYSDRLQYHYGLWKEYQKTFYFGSDDMVAIKSGLKMGLLQKKLNFANFYIINKNKLSFEMKRIANPDGLLDYLTNKVAEFNKYFDPTYKVPPREVINHKGIFIETVNGELIKKTEANSESTISTKSNEKQNEIIETIQESSKQ